MEHPKNRLAEINIMGKANYSRPAVFNKVKVKY